MTLPRTSEDDPIYNTPLIAEFRRCHCHGWRLDECPNAQIAVWARRARQTGAAEAGWLTKEGAR
mgnify:FL=1